MKKVLIFGIVLAVGLLGFAFREELAPKRASAPDYKTYGATTVTNISTVYHTLESYAGDALWHVGADAVAVQIYFNEVTDADTTSTVTATLQASNQLDIATTRWIDIAALPAWATDEDTTINFIPKYALYRLKFVQSDTASSTIETDWIVK